MTLSASSVPLPRAGRPGGHAGAPAGARLRAIDTLLADRGQMFRALFLSSPVPQALVDLDGHLLVVNDALCALAGRGIDDMVGRHVDLLAHPDDAPLNDDVAGEDGALDPWLRQDGERRLRRADGSEVWVQQSHDVVHRSTGEPQFAVLSLVDVTDRRRAEEDLVRRAFTDPLTGLPNRRALTDRLNHALALSRRRGLQVGLVHMDLDRFQAVNDTLGTEAGDQLLSQVADRLRWSTRVEDTAVRLGADEFLILAEDVEDLDGLRALADRLLAVLDDPFVLGGREIVLSASVGLTLGSDVAPDDLLKQAHSALARAKRDGSRARIEVHDGGLTEDEVDLLQLETDLRRALDADELRLFYQPIVSLADETLLGYEALIRWQHPTRGLLPPGAFLDAAENNRLTSRLGAWVLRRACDDAAGWPAGLRVHVNVSARHLAEEGFSELVADVLDASGLPPERLELEITESTALFAAEATLQAVQEVTARGVTLALDDFGTGYSAITALHRLPIHTVKIDRSFVAGVVREPSSAALVQGLLQLGQGMGLQVIAEGIEDLDQADWLRRHGCAMAQGYAFGRPAPLPGRTDTTVAETLVGQAAEEAAAVLGAVTGELEAVEDLPVAGGDGVDLLPLDDERPLPPRPFLKVVDDIAEDPDGDGPPA
ncbi:PAS domain S-box-containing protein/diguanylate cyclase (GGDEF) domain-containing protein [Geodermatophilus obscurus]|uniref:PAS domain S-box-containing protein/diguanylate cyclase (GGDEF) domain-containing protein n=1 Tax=Geodermatophilus obscurus TaxID=1861 RepID=A0A1I5HRS3_9ACTN|nr:EAL domain-containing protein [Geodermatophilus obscurus]SFO51002.1 PAS domain S-box-containing protein/diguanylate cyclase (GGDEF) domain-containing protein [Geodermatophilus obscurus]